MFCSVPKSFQLWIGSLCYVLPLLKIPLLVFIQNGVEIEQEMLDAFPENEVVSSLAFICCNRVGPGEILHLVYGRLALGDLPNGISRKTAQL